ncbi:MAG: PLP-dependent aminotransferase family protein [Desulfosarcina sp.]
MVDWRAHYARNMLDYQGYSIGKLLALIDDPTIISLAGGMPSPEMFLVEQLRQATGRRFDSHIHRIMQYSSIRGETELIDAVIAFLRRDGVCVSPENVMITSSGQQGLDLVGRLFLDPGDALVVERPTFAGALAAFQMQRPDYIGIELGPDGLDVIQLQQVLTDCQAADRLPKFIYVVPDFQNPTGICMSLAKREALLDLSRRHAIPIIEDSPYRSLRYRGSQLPSLYSLDQQRGGGFVVGVYTFSKLFCPGMRVGFTIGPPEVIAKMTNIKEGSTLNTPPYNQDMCADFLTTVDLDAYFESCRTYYREKMNVFFAALNTHFPPERGVTWTRPDGGLFVWLSVPKAVNTRTLFRSALAFKVAFVPGDAFYGADPEPCHMRLNFSYPSSQQLKEAVKRLSDCLAESA